MTYEEFLESKRKPGELYGFSPIYKNKHLKPFQEHLVDWSIRKGRGAIYASCGLGKTPMQLAWAQNVLQKTNKPVLILTPLAVSHQTIREGEKFGIECVRTNQGKVIKGINVTNYERLDRYNAKDFSGIVLDESGCIKNHSGKFRKAVTDFMHAVNYRLLCTATPAPNDYTELGTSCEALGVMGRMQMLGMFFSNGGEDTQQWTLKPHAQKRFWQWVANWARAVRMPSDIGFSDDGYILPALKTVQYVIKSNRPKTGFFQQEAKTLDEQRAERKATLVPRCEKVAELIPKDKSALIWCHYNEEGDLLKKLIPDSVQVAGANSDEEKEDRLNGFATGKFRVLISKPKIGGWGLNYQHCAYMTMFPSHSFEAAFQCVRRCWRFGQKNPVTVAIVTSEAESRVMSNLMRKERQAEQMYAGLVRYMSQGAKKETEDVELKPIKLPEWLKS